MTGIDVSEYQGKIDWSSVKASGVEFAIIRIGWAGYEGHISADDNSLDKMFTANMQGATAAGLPVAAYVYSYCLTPDAAKEAAREAAALVAPWPVKFVAFDMEPSTAAPYRSYSVDTNTAIARAFCDELKAHGLTPWFYSYTNFMQYLDVPSLGVPVWVADYSVDCGYKGAYKIWQYSSDGSVDGISGRVDMNICYDDTIFAGDDNMRIKNQIGIALRCYQYFLGREAEDDGLRTWVSQPDGVAIAGGIGGSNECAEHIKSDADYITACYRAILKREPDAGRSTWEDAMAAGMGRADVARGFAGSDEAKRVSYLDDFKTWAEAD